MRYHYICKRITIIFKDWAISNVSENVEWLELVYITGKNLMWYNHLEIWNFLVDLTIYLFFGPAIQLLAIYLKDRKT